MSPIVIARRVVAALFWLFLLIDLYAWAGLSRDPEVGIAVTKSINHEGVLAWGYARRSLMRWGSNPLPWPLRINISQTLAPPWRPIRPQRWT